MGRGSGKRKDIEARQDYKDENLKFSFQFYDTKSDKYCLSEWNKESIFTTLGLLKDINSKTFNELGRQRVVWHFHPIDWSKTKEKEGFPNRDANLLEPFQFSLIGVNNQKARVFGAYANNTFYIVWFDFDHQIYPSFK